MAFPVSKLKVKCPQFLFRKLFKQFPGPVFALVVCKPDTVVSGGEGFDHGFAYAA